MCYNRWVVSTCTAVQLPFYVTRCVGWACNLPRVPTCALALPCGCGMAGRTLIKNFFDVQMALLCHACTLLTGHSNIAFDTGCCSVYAMLSLEEDDRHWLKLVMAHRAGCLRLVVSTCTNVQLSLYVSGVPRGVKKVLEHPLSSKVQSMYVADTPTVLSQHPPCYLNHKFLAGIVKKVATSVLITHYISWFWELRRAFLSKQANFA